MSKNLHVSVADGLCPILKGQVFKVLSKEVGPGCRVHRATEMPLPPMKQIREWCERRKIAMPLTIQDGETVIAVWFYVEQDFRDFEATHYGLFDAVVTI